LRFAIHTPTLLKQCHPFIKGELGGEPPQVNCNLLFANCDTYPDIAEAMPPLYKRGTLEENFLA
jgi:hypothetical protein